MHLTFKREYNKFIVIKVNFSIVKNNGEEYLYNENNLYFEFNNAGYNGIIQMNYIYNYYIFYLKFKTINNFFFKIMFRFIKKIYKEEETRYWIFTIKTMIYRTFILSFKYPSIYIKEKVILEGY